MEYEAEISGVHARVSLYEGCAVGREQIFLSSCCQCNTVGGIVYCDIVMVV